MLPSTRASEVLEGVETEVVVQRYADRTMVLVSQVGKVGNLIQASIPPTEQLMPPPLDAASQESTFLVQPPPAIELTPLLGRAPSEELAALHSLYTSHIATLIWTLSAQAGLVDRPPIIVGIALKKLSDDVHEDQAFGVNESTRNTFKGVLKMISVLLGTNLK